MIDSYQNDMPFSRKGFGLQVNLYCSGRISAKVAGHGGVTQLCYQGKQRPDRFRIFRASETEVFLKLARVQVLIEDIPYRLTFENTMHYPFGYISECTLGEVRLRHEFILDRNTLLQRIIVLDNPKHHKITARMITTSAVWDTLAECTKGDWIPDYDKGILNTSFSDGKITTTIRMGAAANSRMAPMDYRKFKFYIESPVSSPEHIFYVAFDPLEDEKFDSGRIDRVWEKANALLHEATRYRTGNRIIDSALVNMCFFPAYLELEEPGALRASPYYWVWAWDSMVHAEAMILGGNPEIVKRMCYFFRKHDLSMMYNPSLQGKTLNIQFQFLYPVMLRDYYVLTGDKQTLTECLSFARKVVERCLDLIGRDGSLSKGRSVFPDTPEAIGESETDDYSVINNSVICQGIFAYYELTGEYGELADSMAKNFEKLFWNEKKSFWCSSVNGHTLEQRPHYPCYGQLYVNPRAMVMKSERMKDIYRFMHKNFLCDHGVRMLALDDPGFMADGIQLGEYFPVTDRYYWNVANTMQDSNALSDYERIIAAYWKICTFPEGQTNEIVNTEPTEYEDCPGGKQAFTAKPWLCDFWELNLGFRPYIDGFALNPLGGRDLKIDHLKLRNRSIRIRRTGTGNYPEITLNGTPVKDHFIKWNDLQEENSIVIYMK